MLDQLTKEQFMPYVGTPFHVRLNPQETFELTLAEVLGYPDHEGPRREPFSLIFRGAHSFVLPQRIYRLEHKEMGPIEVFLVPIGPDKSGMGYEAVFN